eukprot:354574-Chlamydomonas_euryale.AAC.6
MKRRGIPKAAAYGPRRRRSRGRQNGGSAATMPRISSSGSASIGAAAALASQAAMRAENGRQQRAAASTAGRRLGRQEPPPPGCVPLLPPRACVSARGDRIETRLTRSHWQLSRCTVAASGRRVQSCEGTARKCAGPAERLDAARGKGGGGRSDGRWKTNRRPNHR